MSSWRGEVKCWHLGVHHFEPLGAGSPQSQRTHWAQDRSTVQETPHSAQSNPLQKECPEGSTLPEMHRPGENCIFGTVALRSFGIPNIDFVKIGLQTLDSWFTWHYVYFLPFVICIHVFDISVGNFLQQVRWTGNINVRANHLGFHFSNSSRDMRPLPSYIYMIPG